MKKNSTSLFVLLPALPVLPPLPVLPAPLVPLVPLLLMVLLMQPFTPALAQALHDPTRPQTGSNGKAMTLAPRPPPLPRLQMVLIGAQRSTVVIDGEVLQVGEHFNGMQIQTIRPDAVVLKTRKGLRTLPLYAP